MANPRSHGSRLATDEPLHIWLLCDPLSALGGEGGGGEDDSCCGTQMPQIIRDRIEHVCF